ncbi:hypothetical protein MKK84_03450 [Methylobacterium sp. E-065]|uniref:hypothetical protein n=1 Tax=Methylobacterium sp. E-065 TaxID=2836583 RepID=UPI001FB8640A|nr:hypothetical protein [Methylobacterium sp. E-065]MCJ2016487.1 hypothetical protein [Methylobacterium sp. E-065]
MRVAFDNDGVDFEYGMRLMTEGEIRLDSQFVVTVGVYQRDREGAAFIRQRTVRVPTGPTARSMSGDKLRAAVERRIRELDDLSVY